MATVSGASHKTTEAAAGVVIPVPIPRKQRPGTVGTSREQEDAPLAQQIKDLNFHLRRLTVIASGDMSQIESFGGGSDFEMFLDAVSHMGIRHGWSEAETLKIVEMKLRNKAREYYGALLPSERPRNMLEMKKFFRRIFEKKLTIAAGKRELERCIREPGESLGEYAQRLRVIVNKMFPTGALVAPEKFYHRNRMLVEQFIKGLDRRLANEILRAGEFYNLEECLEVAEFCEEVVSRMLPETRYDTIRRTEDQQYDESGTGEERYEILRGVENVFQTTFEGNNSGSYPRRQQHQKESQGRGMRAMISNGTDRKSSRIRRMGGEVRQESWGLQQYPYMKNRCTRCGHEGHFSKGCRNQRVLFCFHCGKVGEICDLKLRRPSIPSATR